MGIDIIIVDTPMDRLHKLAKLFKGHYSWIVLEGLVIRINQSIHFNDVTSYSNLSENDLATLEFLPDFDTRYTYLLSLSLGINA